MSNVTRRAALMNEAAAKARIDIEHIKGILPDRGRLAEGAYCVVDGSAYAPSWRVLNGGAWLWDTCSEMNADEAWMLTDTYVEMLDLGTDALGLWWEEGCLWIGDPLVMGDVTLKTNNVPRDILSAWDLTKAERKEFDYYDWSLLGGPEPRYPRPSKSAEDASFFRYKGQLYDLGEFEVWDNPSSPTRRLPSKWDGFRADSYFSGLVVRYVNNYEQVIVGLVMS